MAAVGDSLSVAREFLHEECYEEGVDAFVGDAHLMDDIGRCATALYKFEEGPAECRQRMYERLEDVCGRLTMLIGDVDFCRGEEDKAGEFSMLVTAWRLCHIFISI